VKTLEAHAIEMIQTSGTANPQKPVLGLRQGLDVLGCPLLEVPGLKQDAHAACSTLLRYRDKTREEEKKPE
jgi:hypothetical protein